MQPTIRHNTAKQGIEVQFSTRPADAHTSWLRSKGFRWSSKLQLWYVQYDPSIKKELDVYFAQDMPGSTAAEPMAAKVAPAFSTDTPPMPAAELKLIQDEFNSSEFAYRKWQKICQMTLDQFTHYCNQHIGKPITLFKTDYRITFTKEKKVMLVEEGPHLKGKPRYGLGYVLSLFHDDWLRKGNGLPLATYFSNTDMNRLDNYTLNALTAHFPHLTKQADYKSYREMAKVADEQLGIATLNSAQKLQKIELAIKPLVDQQRLELNKLKLT
jgi:hypothetical protein